MKYNLTPKQREVFDFIDEFIDENGYAPSYREIMNGCCFPSTGAVSQKLKALKERGWIDFLPKQTRSITIL